MLSFLKNWLQKDSPSAPVEKEEIREESILQAESPEAAAPDAANASAVPRGSQLSLHETWESSLDQSQKYALSFMASELPPLAPGSVSLAGIRIFPHEAGVEVTAFIRNGLSRPIRFERMNLLILIGDNQLFARQSFDLSEVGEIPPFHARPWSFVFEREHFLMRDVFLTNWKLAFELAQKKVVLPQQLELEESWIKALNDQQKQALIQLAKRLPPVAKGEVNVQSVQISSGEDQSLRALLLIRNGSDRALSFEKLPLKLFDARGETVAEGLFELNGLTVNPSTSKPWLFIFPKHTIVHSSPDLSRWKVAISR